MLYSSVALETYTQAAILIVIMNIDKRLLIAHNTGLGPQHDILLGLQKGFLGTRFLDEAQHECYFSSIHLAYIASYIAITFNAY